MWLDQIKDDCRTLGESSQQLTRKVTVEVKRSGRVSRAERVIRFFQQIPGQVQGYFMKATIATPILKQNITFFPYWNARWHKKQLKFSTVFLIFAFFMLASGHGEFKTNRLWVCKDLSGLFKSCLAKQDLTLWKILVDSFLFQRSLALHFITTAKVGLRLWALHNVKC